MANIEKGTALHRAFSVFLFNSDNELLLQKRAACKITFPNFWTNTVCSHPIQFVDQGPLSSSSISFLFHPLSLRRLLSISLLITTKNSYSIIDGIPVTEQPEMESVNQTGVKKAAIRKLFQELGIESNEVPIQDFKFLTRIIYQAASDTVWGEHEGKQDFFLCFSSILQSFFLFAPGMQSIIFYLSKQT